MHPINQNFDILLLIFDIQNSNYQEKLILDIHLPKLFGTSYHFS